MAANTKVDEKFFCVTLRDKRQEKKEDSWQFVGVTAPREIESCFG